ncbi:2-dehydropantoate 2-reductase [Lojkania enalia]|uniref:2-dehydropantoate 2-reductase n=1 Tax=Lojkania enalia TaxID=147567 RepID=A0A9P4K0T0_9PLEO|nr:2-dehydropantoate 2-reductase [Didymosphaeria enalia]
MSSPTRPKILLFGAGSVGAVYLYLLSKVSNVTAVLRSNYDSVKENGFTINSSIFGQGIRFIPNVVRSCSEAAELDSQPFDYILICSKAIPDTIPKLMEPAVTRGHTIIALLQNGIGIEQEYADAFPTNPIVSCVVYIPATQRPAGVIKHGEIELIEIGAYPSTAPAAPALAFTNLMKVSGATAEFYEDVQVKRWFKLLVNASWNPICALSLSADVFVIQSSPLAIDVVLDVMLEVREIAQAYGYVFSREQVEFQLDRAKARIPINAGIEPSMLQDVKEGRRIEVEAIVGNPVRMAKEKGISCGKLEMLYVLAKALDVRIGTGDS